MEIPVGEIFETVIRWLKANFDDLFEAISSTINLAISTLERILSVAPHHWYPMLVMSLLISALVYGLMRRKVSWKWSLSLSMLVLLVCGGLDVWRNQSISHNVTGAEIQALRTVMEQFEDRLGQVSERVEEQELNLEEGRGLMTRLATRLDRASPGQLRSSIFNLRNFERSQAFLAQIKDSNPHGTGLEIASAAQALWLQLRLYDPEPLAWYSWFVASAMMALLAWFASGRGLAVFALLGCWLIESMGYWDPTVETLALVLSATFFALLIGVPLGIGAAGSKVVDRVSKPVLDFMQTMPAFVYLIPAVLFFGLGKVPGAIATLIFAMPPAVRLTSLGIRGVPTEVVEAAQSFGSTPRQLLVKAQLPIALPTILAGLNQTIMLALSMVVIGGMIGAGGLGEVVLSGITQLKIGLGFESGLAVVILAIYLDRLTQAIGNPGGKN